MRIACKLTALDGHEKLSAKSQINVRHLVNYALTESLAILFASLATIGSSTSDKRKVMPYLCILVNDLVSKETHDFLEFPVVLH